MRVILSVLLLSIALLTSAQDVTRQERKVRRLLAKDKAYPALRIATGMLSHPGHPEFYALRASAFNAIAEYEKAERDARASMRALPDSTAGLFQLALAEGGMGRWDSAQIHLQQVLAKDPSMEVRYRLALVERSQGRCSVAIDQLDQALAVAGSDTSGTAPLYRVKGECAAILHDTTMARIALDRAVELAPKDPVNYNSRGYYLHAYVGDHRGAIVEYDKAIKINPNYSYAFNNRGWSRYKLGDVEQGVKDIEKARKKKVFNPYVYRNLGVIAIETGDTAKACVYFRQALDRGFTALYGTEVEELATTSCGSGQGSGKDVPVQAPQGTLDRPDSHPVPRTNAP